MKKFNVIMVFNKTEDKVLMCLRAKDPYKGLYNFVGGKIEEGENDMSAAYRELFEETGISAEDIALVRLMDFSYNISNVELRVFAGKLNKDKKVVDEVNPLVWIDVGENFFDSSRFAGEGICGHMLAQAMIHRDKALLANPLPL
jgi:8-oxo-dGTP diphosphatase